MTDLIAKYIENGRTITHDEVRTILSTEGTVTPTSGAPTSVKTTKGGHDISVTDIWDVVSVTP